jgi:hypothetical protein
MIPFLLLYACTQDTGLAEVDSTVFPWEQSSTVTYGFSDIVDICSGLAALDPVIFCEDLVDDSVESDPDYTSLEQCIEVYGGFQEDLFGLITAFSEDDTIVYALPGSGSYDNLYTTMTATIAFDNDFGYAECHSQIITDGCSVGSYPQASLCFLEDDERHGSLPEDRSHCVSGTNTYPAHFISIYAKVSGCGEFFDQDTVMVKNDYVDVDAFFHNTTDTMGTELAMQYALSASDIVDAVEAAQTIGSN